MSHAISLRLWNMSLICSALTVGCITNAEPTTDTEDSVAGEAAGEVAGEAAGEVAGEAAGEVAGEAAGETATTTVCPIPRATEELISARVSDVVTLDGSPSRSGLPDLEIVSYEWVIVTRPVGSRAQVIERFNDRLQPELGGVVDDLSTPEAVFSPDRAGLYQIQLFVVDEAGNDHTADVCDPEITGLITINVEGDGLLIDVTWDTPNDPDQSDANGTDVDLHFLRPDAMGWSVSPDDCYYANPNPDWGDPGPENNPSLDIDDVNGAGPERLIYSQPTLTTDRPYQVGIHYYSDGLNMEVDPPSPFGPSIVTAEVYIDGFLVENASRELEVSAFWVPFEISWSELGGGEVSFVDRFYSDIMEAPVSP